MNKQDISQAEQVLADLDVVLEAARQAVAEDDRRESERPKSILGRIDAWTERNFTP